MNYYGTPMLQEPVWEWGIPAYFYVGGVSGVSATFGALLRIADARGNCDVAKRCREIAAAGAIVSAALLITDLGRPARFLYMLRVFRPTSPMSVGSWILAGFGASASAALLMPAAEFGSALLGLPLATYTAVLISNTAVPAWQDARAILPFLFAGSAMAGAASLLELTVKRQSYPVRMLAAAGGITEVLTANTIRLPDGLSGTLWSAAKVMSAASIVLSLWPGKSRTRRLVSGTLGTAAALTFRFAIVQAGRVSSRSPAGK